ncbi:MltA-interacting MipA family protein [Enterobacter cloacae subsp. cloacae]|uniref:MipA/OmpV family protein n=1 Tax=Enterobacterales TaxID=91347 RepID=UPI0009A540E3|nr:MULTISPECIES: MipA/OmpV family protein [Enterobacterales]OPJ93762.1 MltA-interacting MipA family protein [Serratia marcescens]OPJ99470.1 MltA-interacting MipA family protein [Serratia marcescens]ORC18527.1 MltA-interacting MipA family protein [Enterobacter cloacae subsp. cloacae]ORC28728.1 MltA-interacting MipA family protein [Enterobacter cloacae subsp. cloacae]
MITRKLMMYMTCFTLTGLATTARADDASPQQPTLSVGLAGQNLPRYSGSDKRRWQVIPLVQARDGAFFLDTQKGIGYDLQSDSGLYLEHTLGYNLGRSDRDSDWRDGSDKLRGMGNIKATVNTAFAVGWTLTPWLTVEAKATLPLSDSQGVNYQTSATLIPLQTASDTVAFSTAALFGDSRYMNTIYGVSNRQAGRSGYAPYHAAGGFYGTDSNLTWSHQFTPEWGALASVDYTWLDRNAKDSPIVFRRNGTSVTLGVLYTF